VKVRDLATTDRLILVSQLDTSARIVGGLFAHNNDEGLDIDNVADTFVANLISRDNVDGSGLQIEADNEDAPICRSKFSTATLITTAKTAYRLSWMTVKYWNSR
jgi:hypothetical protein